MDKHTGKKYHFYVLAAAVIIAEIISAFYGKYAFVRKPSLVLAPVYVSGLDPAETDNIQRQLEKELAETGSFSVFPRSLIENYFLEKENKTDVFNGKYLDKEKLIELGRALGVKQIAKASVLVFSGEMHIYLSIFDVSSSEVIANTEIKTKNPDTFYKWLDISGNSINLSEALGIKERGMGLSGYLFIAWLSAVFVLLIIIFTGYRPGRLFIEILFGAGLMLFLFSWIYALNGDMDYVQRFVATSGLLTLGNTVFERTAAVLRYVPLLLFLGGLWAADIKFSAVKYRYSRLNLYAPLLAAVSVFLYTLSLPDFIYLKGIPLLAWFSLVPLYIALKNRSFSENIFLLLFFFGLKSMLLNWWQGTFSYISLPFTVFITLLQNLPFILLLSLTVKKLPCCRFISAALLWTGWEWVCSLGFLGYPWGILGVSQYSSSGIIQSASVGGVWLISLYVHVINALIAGTADKFLSGKENYKSAGSVLRALIPLFSGVVFILIVSSAGLIVINKRDSLKSVKNQQENKKVKILLVQQNTDPRKHDYRLSFERLSELTGNALSKNGPYDLVVWPESGFVPDVRFWLAPERSGWKRAKLVKEFLDWQKKAAIPLVTGNQDHYYEGEKKHIMNSALYLPPDRKDDFERYYYYKIKLVPFTENFPYGKQFPWIEKLLHNFSTTQWTPGNEYTVFHAPSFKFSTPICFEDTFPGHVRRFVKEGAMILVNMSNDYWANTPLEGYQHGAHAIFRAVENRRPLVRATCSGWTIAVDPEGRILPGWPDFYTEAAYSAELDIPPDKLTFYTRFGDWVPVLSLIIWLAGSGIILLRLLYAEAARGRRAE